MIDGRKFNGIAELKGCCSTRKEDFVRGFVEQMLTYSLGRKLEFYDVATVNADHAGHDRRTSTIFAGGGRGGEELSVPELSAMKLKSCDAPRRATTSRGGSMSDARKENTSRSFLTRRQLLKAGGIGALAMGMPGAVAASVDANRGLRGEAAGRSCIFLLLCGGPSHLDTWDLKPDAPRRFAGRIKPDRHGRARHADLANCTRGSRS